MPLYSTFGLVLDSEIAIPELPELSLVAGAPDVTVRRATLPWIERKTTIEEEQVLNVECGAFRILEGREILVDASGADGESMRVMLLGRVMAFLLRQRGWLPLHASGIAIQGRAVLFVGPSGSGKSTTAAAFHARGHTVITDDVGPIRLIDGTCVVQPGQPRVRLLDNSRPVLENFMLDVRFQSDKHSYDLGVCPSTSILPVKRIYILDAAESIHIQLLPPVVSAAILHRHSFIKLRRSVPEVLAAHLEQCASIASIMPVHMLGRLMALDSLPELVRNVEADLSSD